MTTNKVYFSIGSNIEPELHIKETIKQFKADFFEAQISNIYRNPAIGFDGEDFLNLVICIETEKSLSVMLKYANQLELAAGRERVSRGRFDSRTLDVDLIMFGDLSGTHHGRLWPDEDIDQTHVLRSLVDIAGDQFHPIKNESYSDVWREVDKRDVKLTKVDFCKS